MDTNECDTLISVARNNHGKSMEQILNELNDATIQFKKTASKKFGGAGEW